MTTPLEIVIEGTADAHVLVLHGEIDVASVVGLRTAVDELPRQPSPLTIDLGGVGFMDSSGIGWLAGLARTGWDVTLRSTPEPLRKLLDVTGVAPVLTVADED